MRQVFISDDGKHFDNEDDCRLHEMTLKVDKCPDCNGRGGHYIDDGHDCWGNRESRFESCLTCKGTGIKDKKWQKRKDLLEQITKLEYELGLL